MAVKAMGAIMKVTKRMVLTREIKMTMRNDGGGRAAPGPCDMNQIFTLWSEWDYWKDLEDFIGRDNSSLIQII
jgi:hypothetical protein